MPRMGSSKHRRRQRSSAVEFAGAEIVIDPGSVHRQEPSEMIASAPDPKTGAATLVELIRGLAQGRPDSPAFTFLVEGKDAGDHLTFGDLDRRARAIGAHLRA